jgi:cystathionine beta-lyase
MSMHYQFDHVPERRDTGSLKWQRYAGRDVLPMWVADMDFVTAPEVQAAIEARVAHGVFGYSLPQDSLNAATCAMLARDYDWQVDPDWLVWLPGVVPGMAACCRIAGELGDEVIASPPVYHHFLHVAQPAGRKLVTAPLARIGGRYEHDLDALRGAITDRSRLYLLCNPQNPTGRVFEREELRALLQVCAEHDLLVCSDEIHCGLVLNENRRHIPSALALPEYAERMITLMSASKTFNIAGLNCAFAVIQNPAQRARFRATCRGALPMNNAIGLAATEAAYRDGEPWRAALLDTLRANHVRLREAVAAMPGVSMNPVEATYLAWLDVRELALENPVAFFEGAGVGLSGGAEFGDGNYLRLNFGCPRAQLDAALARMRDAIAAH